jgi:hypothetical protein
MAGEKGESVTVWIESLKAGDADAAQKLWRRYFEALVRLARERLRGAPRAVADEEDAALSAFDSFVRGTARGRYPHTGQLKKELFWYNRVSGYKRYQRRFP